MPFYRKLCGLANLQQQKHDAASISNDYENKRVHKLVVHKFVNSLGFR